MLNRLDTSDIVWVSEFGSYPYLAPPWQDFSN